MRNLSFFRPICAGLVLMSLVALVGSGLTGSCRAAEFDVYRLKHVAPSDAKRILHKLADGGAGELQIVADRETNTLMVGGSQELRTLAGELLQEIDRAPAASPAVSLSAPQPVDVIRTYPISAENLAGVAARLQQLLKGRARVATDAGRAQLIVAAPPNVHDLIAKHLADGAAPPAVVPARAVTGALRQTTRAVATTQPPSSYVFRVRSANEVVQTLRRFFSDRLQPQGPDMFLFVTPDRQRLTIRFEPSANRCLLSGSRILVRQFFNLLEQIDSPQSDPDRITRLMAIRNTQPDILQEAVDTWRNVRNQQAASTVAAPAVSQAESSIDQNRRRAAYRALGISGPSAVQQVADEQPRADEAAAVGPLRRPSSDVEIQSLPDLDVIILRGLGADVEELTRIINEIERLSAETTPEIEVYHLQHVQGEAANRLITQVLQDLTGTLQGRVSITPLVKPNALLLIGWGEAVEAAKKLISQLDQPVPATTQIRVFRLEHATAAQVQTTIDQFYAGRTGLAPQVEITADPRTNSLMVNASPRDLEELELLIRQLDVDQAAAVNQGRVIRLKNSLAADVAQTVQAAINAARGGGGGANAGRSAVLEMLLVDPDGQRVVRSGLLNEVRITADSRLNSLIVTGPEQSMDLVEALIHQLDETPAASAQIKVFQVVNGDATEMVLMLRTLFPAQAGASNVPQLPAAEGETSLVPVRFSVDSRTNSILATGSASDLRIIEALLARLDAEEAQQRVNKVYRLRNSPAIDVASAVNEFLRNERIVQRAAPGRPNPFQQIESEVVVVAEPVGNSLIISASPRYYEEILDLVKSLDEQPPQVLVQVVIAEVDLSNFHELGIELGLQDSLLFDRSLLGDLVTTTMSTALSTPAGVVTTTDEIIQAASNTPGFNFNNFPLGNSGSDRALATSGTVAGQALSHFNVGRVNSELGYGGMVLSASSENVSMLIRALDQRTHVEILSRPQIMTLDNQPAFIQVGERVPRITGTSINNVGQVNTISLEDVGLILGITPRISPEGMVVMDIDAEKSKLGPEIEGIPVSISAEGEVVRSPRIDITRAQTTVSAASGQTIVLGGLITNDRLSVSRRVPWLGDIPLLGDLFRYDSYKTRRKELLIIMTPHVILGPHDADYHKQIEMSRMSWCSSDVYEFFGPGGPPSVLSGQYDESGTPVIYPDQTPGMEWQDDGLHDPTDPQFLPNEMPILPRPAEPTPLPNTDGRELPSTEADPDRQAGQTSATNGEPDRSLATSPSLLQTVFTEEGSSPSAENAAKGSDSRQKPSRRSWWPFRTARKEGTVE